MSAHVDIVSIHVRDKEAARLLHREEFGFEQCATPQAQERYSQSSRRLGLLLYIRRCPPLGPATIRPWT